MPRRPSGRKARSTCVWRGPNGERCTELSVDRGRCARHQTHGVDGSWNPDRDLAAHRRFAKAVKDRDRWTCRRCGARGPEAKLVAHHIRRVADGGGYAVSNGVTLCGRCHRLADPPGGAPLAR